MTREEIVDSMSLQDAIQVFKDTNAYGTMDIAKSVILKALKERDVLLDKIRAELIQSIQNGVLKIENGNEELFNILDKYKAESEVRDANND